MFEVNIPDKFTRVDGRPFRKRKQDEIGKEIEQLDSEGKSYLPPRYETEEATYLDMLSWFLNNLFDLIAIKAKENKDIKRLTYEDSALATDIFRSIHVSTDGILELERVPKEWLGRMLTQHGVDWFGVNIAIITEPIKNAIDIGLGRAERRRATKKDNTKVAEPV